jgi:MFS family permease
VQLAGRREYVSIRFAIIYTSVFLVLALLVLFLAAPLWGLRLDTERGQQIQLIQIGIPIFLSYLASAVTYATVRAEFPEPTGERGKILRTITLGGFAIFVLGFIVSTLMFYQTANGTLPNALNFQQYTNVITILLGVLGVTTSAVSTFVFAAKQDEDPHNARNMPNSP